jgi:hypothetical protein
MDSGLYSVDGFTSFHGADNKPATQPLNETKVISRRRCFRLFFLVGLGVVVTDDPETTPSVTYLVIVVWTLSIALNVFAYHDARCEWFGVTRK